ncbi:MAG: hypothetical protein NTX71_08460 [Candidatus Aureabacteria bacterium]|nr:hypothetical protein [Candidatus Auribacterota bacterium]
MATMTRATILAIISIIGAFVITALGNSQAPASLSTSVEFPDQEAAVLALETSGELLPPEDLYNQIHADLAAIRLAYPDMNMVTHMPPWTPGELEVTLTPEAMDQYKKGEYHGLDVLNVEYGPVKIVPYDTCLVLRFTQPYHPSVLAVYYGEADGVSRVEPAYIAGDGSRIRVFIPHYEFNFGWGDCPAGCIFRHYWDYTVVDGSVTLVKEGGDLLPGVTPDPAPTATPLLKVNVSSSELLCGQAVAIDVTVQPLQRLIDVWAVIKAPGGEYYSLIAGTTRGLCPGARVYVTHIEGIKTVLTRRLFSSPSLMARAPGNYSVIVGIVPAMTVPRGVQNCIPGYADTAEVMVR